MKFEEYYKARSEVIKILKDDLLGPVQKDEVISEPPVGYYLIGKLYPKNMDRLMGYSNETVAEDILKDDEGAITSTSFYPSAMGLTFALSQGTSSFQVKVKAAVYQDEVEKIETEVDDRRWKREEIDWKQDIDIQELEGGKVLYIKIREELQLHVRLHHSNEMNKIKITCSIFNGNEAAGKGYAELSKVTVFQPELIINECKNGEIVLLNERTGNISDFETNILNLLYHNIKNYASAHGCAVDWTLSDNKVKSIQSVVLPSYELLQMKASGGEGKLFSMRFLANSSFAEIKSEFDTFLSGYNKWIEHEYCRANDLDIKYKESSINNLEQCEEVSQRLRNNFELIRDPLVFSAFRYANETMLRQRYGHAINKHHDAVWYPFQLMFMIQEIKSIVEPDCEEREYVDLLWFPTGGGKTEAYLGVAAFTIFYRRMRQLKQNMADEGVAVIMRYTLRLLSLQQLERASSMICAAEYIRRREKLGIGMFSIGLWAGSSLTPNLLKDAEDYLLKGSNNSNSNPVQVKVCPWCGASIGAENYRIDKVFSRMVIQCPNNECEYHKGLPLMLIDEEIYEHKPTFLIGTIDKFAQIAFKSKAGDLLYSPGGDSPELIIQDELHLISGPLGTISGVYECAIQKLCENAGIKPKIIAATATIRNADNQILQLYGKEKRQFPPQGISINDSYFAVISERDERPAREYIGIMPSGVSKTIAFTRVMASLLFATRYLMDAGYSDEVIDSFWTETGYFNTLKELGTALTRVSDSVQERFLYLKKTKFAEKYPLTCGKNRYENFFELTSRNSSVDLSQALQQELQIKYSSKKSTNPVDVLLASNMISVGVDVARLGTMLVVGQPLKSAEYIQATSRVGRKTPGLVLTLYQATNSRDYSHYEQFKQYHSTFYKYVEATSLTPFSDRSRDRALQALYIILARYMVDGLKENEDVISFKRNLPGLDEIKEYIYTYVQKIDPDEVNNVKNEIHEIEVEWESEIERNNGGQEMVYWDYFHTKVSLFKSDIEEGERFRMMNSMRNVEPAIGVYVEE